MYYLFALITCWLDVLRTLPSSKTKRHKMNSTYDLNGRYYESIGCRKDRHCQTFKFCHRYERICMNCRTEGQMCRRNKMCCRGMECASGKCRRKIELGRFGALCNKDRDCNYNLCCARENGQSVCKQMLQHGDICGIREGGRKYLWSHQCPCAYGLKCKTVGNIRQTNSIQQLQHDWGNGSRKLCVRQHKIS